MNSTMYGVSFSSPKMTQPAIEWKTYGLTPGKDEVVQTCVSWERKGNEQPELLILGVALLHDRGLWYCMISFSFENQLLFIPPGFPRVLGSLFPQPDTISH